MNYLKEIQTLHNKGFVILRASRITNAPIGWKDPKTKNYGYIDQMNDPHLIVYRETFSADITSKSHCGFYLGFGNLCCIDIDTKKDKIDAKTATKLKDDIVKALGASVVVELTKSNGFHIYFLYDKRLDNNPNWTGKGGKDNWIELYYHKRFIACYLSNSKKYKLLHGSILDLKALTEAQHKKLITILSAFKGKEQAKPAKTRKFDVDKQTWNQAEAYVKQLEAQKLDITGDNPQWFKIGKGFANAFGYEGFKMFNRLSRFSELYNADTIEEEYNGWVNTETRPREKKITIASFFKLCEDAGLKSLEATQALQMHPPSEVKEFDLLISKKESMPEHVHTLVDAFLRYINIQCIDKATIYVYEYTHWVRRNERYVVDLINNFVDRSNVEDKYRKKFRTVPYLKMALEEIRMITQVDAIEPKTGNLHEGIFINMENGVLHINLKTGKRKLLDHDAKYNFTTILPFCYDVSAECPRFDSWLETQVPNKDLHEAYYAFVASCLTRHKADIIMLLAGETSTGKSSLIDITRRLIGIENSAPISAGTLFSGQSDAATQAMQMENKLLAYDFDAQPFKHLEMLLKVAAGEPIPGWQMNIARRPVVNYARLIIAMNPYNYSVFNPAVARRFITINMDVPVVKDNSVIPAIYENELAGIFNHVMNIGVKHLIANGGQIHITEEMRQITLAFHTKARDAVRWFEQEYIKLAPSYDKSNKRSAEEKVRNANPKIKKIELTSISDLYTKFRNWLEDVEGYPMHKIPIRKHFAADLKLIGVEDSNIMTAAGLRHGVYVGLK